MTVALCCLLPVSSASVRFASSALSFAFSIFLRSLSYFLRSPLCCPLTFSLMSLLLLCFLSLSFSNLSLCFGFSSGFYSQRTQAFLGNGRRASWWRETCPPPQTETAPLMAFIYCQNHRAWRWWAVVKETAPFSNSKNISRLVLGRFLRFCNQTPG